jgi:hypothetical protein
MLLPDKHITLAESILGLGAVVLSALDRPRSIDDLYHIVQKARTDGSLPAFYNFDSVLLALLFLYSVGLIEATDTGGVRRCAS